MTRPKSGRGSSSGKSGSRSGRSSGSTGKGNAAKKKAAGRRSGSRSRRRPAAPAPEAPSSGAPDGGSIDDLLPSVARRQLQEVREQLVGEHGFLAYCDHVITNYGAHKAAYDLLKSYLDDCKTTFLPEHEKAVKALGFTDGTDYVPVLRRVAELNKVYKDAEEREESGEDSEEVKGLKKQIEDLQKKVEEGSKAVDGQYEMCKWEHDKLIELISDPQKIEDAYAKGGKAKTSLLNSTYFPRGKAKGKARTKPENMTIATWYIQDSYGALDDKAETCAKLDDYMERMRPLVGDLGKPSE